jgi:hypothetical protein
MIREKKMFASFEANEDPCNSITFIDNGKWRVLDYCKIVNTTEHSISNVLLVESLDYNLLFISQHYETGYNCLFRNKCVAIFRRNAGSFAFKGVLKGKVYLVDFSPDEVELQTCLVAKDNMGWLWHRRLALIDMRNLHKLQKEGHIIGLTDVVFEKDGPCGAYQVGK